MQEMHYTQPTSQHICPEALDIRVFKDKEQGNVLVASIMLCLLHVLLLTDQRKQLDAVSQIIQGKHSVLF